MPFVSDRRLCLTLDDVVVEADDPRSAFLLVGKGGTLDDVTARKYGLSSAILAPSAPASRITTGADASNIQSLDGAETEQVASKSDGQSLDGAETKAVVEFEDKAVKPDSKKAGRRK